MASSGCSGIVSTLVDTELQVPSTVFQTVPTIVHGPFTVPAKGSGRGITDLQRAMVSGISRAASEPAFLLCHVGHDG